MPSAVDDGARLVAQEGTPEILDFPTWMVWLIQLTITGLAVMAVVSLAIMLGVALHQLLDSEDKRTWEAKRQSSTFFDQEKR